MEGKNGEENSGSSSRWNPTTEQVGMLESLYNQGVRTPSTEQIQEITGRLRAFGHVEGKNVFYWFQNHKARQRQKQKDIQKQESLAYYNHFPHKPCHFFSPHHSPSPNVVCSPYYLQRNDIGNYQQCPQMVLPSNMNDRGSSSPDPNEKETLDLFPVHPTGILRGRNESSSN